MSKQRKSDKKWRIGKYPIEEVVVVIWAIIVVIATIWFIDWIFNVEVWRWYRGQS